jgi:hypothetical protein
MAENALDQIVERLRDSGAKYFPGHSAVKAVRVIGRTPKPEHCVYEIVVEFARENERVNAKVYRPGACGNSTPQALAANEVQNLTFAWQAARREGLDGVPRPLGDFSELGAVVSTKTAGLPLQNVIMRTALLPGLDSGKQGLLETAARQTGVWLAQFHRATAKSPVVLEGEELFMEMEKLCAQAAKDGLPAESTDAILDHARSTLAHDKQALHSSAILNDFLPPNVLIGEPGVGFGEFANLCPYGAAIHDVAKFLAAVEALERYPFCNRDITALVEDAFLRGYGIAEQERSLLTLLKMKTLLQMLAQGRSFRQNTVRKKLMWANVMKRFIQQVTERSLAT